MTWTPAQQTEAEATNTTLKTEFSKRWAAWNDAINAGQIDTSVQKAAAQDALTRWQANMNSLQNISEQLIGNDSSTSRISALATQIAEEKATLNKLLSESGTRSNQSESVNPKIKSIPATNMLGLNRVFRSSTRLYLIILSILFGLLAVTALIYFVSASGVIGYIKGKLGGGSTVNNFGTTR